MGAGASLQEDVPTGWHALAAMAEAADKPDLVAKIVRENQIDAATALKLDDDDLRELVDRKLDFKKLQGARDELRERLVPARAGGTLTSDKRKKFRARLRPARPARLTGDSARGLWGDEGCRSMPLSRALQTTGGVLVACAVSLTA